MWGAALVQAMLRRAAQQRCHRRWTPAAGSATLAADRTIGKEAAAMTTVLCFGDSNTHGSVPMEHRDDIRRFGPDERWPGVLRNALGAGWTVIEEGLPGRTTVHDDPIEGVHKNGLWYLRACLESHRPFDMMTLMLGTNDLKSRFAVQPLDIAESVGILLDTVARSGAGPNNGAPRVLLMAPPPLAKLTFLGDMFHGGTEKSQRLGAVYRHQADKYGAAFLDAGTVIRTSDVDGVHFDAGEHAKLGKAVANAIRAMK
jgi:lysophospholipase L1-like esterase